MLFSIIYQKTDVNAFKFCFKKENVSNFEYPIIQSELKIEK